MNTTPYSPCPGGTRTANGPFFGISRSSLWIGPDHLLLVVEAGFREDYRRFYFRDIRGIAVARTNAGRNWNIILALLVVAAALVGLATRPIGLPIAAAAAGLLLTAMLLNTIRGATCACTIHTAVQTCRLTAINRIPRYRQAIAALHPRILASQTDADPTGPEAPPDTP